MRLSMFLILAGTIGLYASTTYSQVTKIDLNVKDVTLSELLTELGKKYEFSFWYSSKVLESNRKISIQANGVTIDKLLDQALPGNNLRYAIKDKIIFIYQSSDLTDNNNLVNSIQSLKVTGVIKDAITGDPLPGVNILVEGTTLGVTSDLNGAFTIEVPAKNSFLVFSFVGYMSERVEVTGGQLSFNISLVPDIKNLEEVVVIGYGVQKKSDVSGAVASVRIDDIKKIATTNVSSALQGSVAGVSVSPSGGSPGAGAEIKIRGTGTFGNTNPLFIIDGVPSDLYWVNPEDIESIDVLKDASAAAIYGSRAGNGVIIVNTKRGKKGGTKINFGSYFSINQPSKELPFITNSNDYISVIKQALSNNGIAPTSNKYPQFVKDFEANPSKYPNTDWQDAYFQKAPMQKYDLNISGGQDNYNFSISGTYSKEDGIIIRTNIEKMGVRINSDLKKGRFRFGESFAANRGIGTGRYNAAYSFYSLRGMAPLTPIYNPQSPSGFSTQNFSSGLAKEGNAIASIQQHDNSWDNIQLSASAYGELQILKGLKFTSRASQQIFNGYSFAFTPVYLNINADAPEITFDQNQLSNLDESRSRSINFVWENFLNFDYVLGKNNISGVLGTSREKYDYSVTGGYVENLKSNNLRVLNSGSEKDNAYGYKDLSRLESYYTRVNYNFDEKYYLQFNYRIDGSSKFDKDNRWGKFPSFSFAWRISKESFFNVPFINELKLRGSYGTLGMQEFGTFKYLYNIGADSNSTLNYPFGDGPDQVNYVGARATYYPSVGIKWETSVSKGIGLEMRLFNNSLTLEGDYYIKQNKDILYDLPIPLSAGSTQNPTVNACSMDNKGIELSAKYLKTVTQDFRFSAGITLSTYNNEVVKMATEKQAIMSGAIHWAFPNTTQTVVGQPLGSFWLYQTSGIFHSQTEVDEWNKQGYSDANGNFVKLQPDAKPGDLRIVDQNKDGKITVDDKKFMGSGQPKAELGFNVSASYKAFDFNMLFYSVFGKKMINGAKWFLYDVDAYTGYHALHKDLLNAWSPTNTGSDIPRVIAGNTKKTNLNETDFFLENASYGKLKHIELGFTFPKSLCDKIKIDRLRIYIASDNLFTITKYEGYDPAIDFDDKFSRGVDRSPFPIPKQYLGGIQLSF